MKMPEQLEELFRKIEFGSQHERFQAIVALGNVKAGREEALLHLWPIVTEETGDLDERL